MKCLNFSMKMDDLEDSIYTIEIDLEESSTSNKQTTDIQFDPPAANSTNLGSREASRSRSHLSITNSRQTLNAWDEVFAVHNGKDKKPHDMSNKSIVVVTDSLDKNIDNTANHQITNSHALLGLCGILIPAFAVLYTTILTAWPQHNVILHPEYWYEYLIPLNLGIVPIAAITTLIECSIVMKRDIIWSFGAFLRIALSSSFGCSLTYAFVYWIWVHLLRYRHPMPFVGHICLITTYIIKCTYLWFLFPSNLRINNEKYRNRLIAYISTFPLSILIGVGYSHISSLFFRVPLDIQWTIGLILPLLKEFILWLYAKVVFKATAGDELTTKVMTICCVGSVHSFSIALLLSSKVTSTTAHLIMFLDFIPNLWLFRKIWKLRYQGTEMARAQQKIAFTCLTLKEYFELAIPFVYCTSFVVAYYGPNASIIGNVKNDYWQYKKVENIFEKLSNNGIFFFIDAMRGMLFGLILKRFCNLNMYETHLDNIRSYGILMITNMTGILSLVTKIYLT